MKLAPTSYAGCATALSRWDSASRKRLRTTSMMSEAGTALLGRLAIPIASVRPALLPAELKAPLRELKAFRHVFVHAYELELDPDKLRLLLKYGDRVGERLISLVHEFVSKVSAELQLG